MPILIARTTETIRARLESDKDPARRRNLEIVLRHLESELAGDIVGTLATLVAEPAYRIHGYRLASGAIVDREIVGSAAVREMYRANFQGGALRLQELDMQILVVDATCVAFDGLIKVAMSGHRLLAAGYGVLPARNYLYQGRSSCFFPISRDGLINGEVIYLESRGFEGIEARPVSARDVRRS